MITTHSPLVINELSQEDAQVIVLNTNAKEEIVTYLKHFSGRDIKSLFYEFYGILGRPKVIQKEIEELWELIDIEDIPKAEAAFSKLQKRLGDNDPVIIESRTSIELLKELL